MALNDSSLDLMLNGLDIDLVGLHSGDPGVAGDVHVVAAAEAVTLAAPADEIAGRSRAVATQVDFTGLTPGDTVSHLSWWKAGTPNVYRGYTTRDSGDAAVNAAGEYSITVVTKIILNNA